jgi:multiple sugar transport system substrate-binding protein
MRNRYRTAVLAACGAFAVTQAAAGFVSAQRTASAEAVTISVSNLPPSTEAGAREAFLQRVEEFQAEYPNITVEPNEYQWDVATFAAQLAGGTLPTVFQIPFTDSQGLIERGQVADISAEFEQLPYAADFNPNVLTVVQNADGAIFGIPIAGYSIGLHYNRALFEEAGLDPNAPPTTWEEVRQAAAAIAEATGQAGFAQMTQDNTGGWMLTTLSYAFGGRLQEETADGVDVTIDNPGTIAALEYLQSLRWEDNSMGANFLFNWGTINQAFAAGQVGMYMGGSDVYNSLVTENGIDPDTYGLTVIPLEGADAGVLAGDTATSVHPTPPGGAPDAAVKWIDFYYMGKLTDEAAAVADAEALDANDAPIGTPALPIFSAEQLAQSDAWVADFVNVPQDQMAPFKDNFLDQPLIPEPPSHTQEMYAILDTVVQTILTEEGADVGALLAQADADVTALVESAA